MLINRQAAIDAILHNQEVYSHNFGDDPIDKYTIAIIDNDVQTIAQLPSAEPKTCAYWDRESNFCTLHRPSAQPSYSCSHEKDAQPRRKGKWIPHSEKSREYIGTVLVSVMYDYWFCGTCGYRVKQPMYNFCPNCGDDMRGEENG